MLTVILPPDYGFSAGVVTLGIRRAESTGSLIALAPGKGDLELGLAFARDNPEIALGCQRGAELHFNFLGAVGHPANRLLNRGGNIGQRAERFFKLIRGRLRDISAKRDLR